jgi:hypothetical protein
MYVISFFFVCVGGGKECSVNIENVGVGEWF